MLFPFSSEGEESGADWQPRGPQHRPDWVLPLDQVGSTSGPGGFYTWTRWVLPLDQVGSTPGPGGFYEKHVSVYSRSLNQHGVLVVVDYADTVLV